MLAIWMVVAVSGCDSLLDVDNPNNVLGDDTLDPTAATAVVNGALFTLQDGYADMLPTYSTVSDELHWIGSRDAWLELEQGTPNNPANEFVDRAFPTFAQARWMTDEAIEILLEHQANDVLEDESDLARAYLYAAISYVNIADWFDDFAFSDRQVAGPPIGADNMGALYTTAIGYLTSGLAIAAGTFTDEESLERDLLAMRARTRRWPSMTLTGYSSSITVRRPFGVISGGRSMPVSSCASATTTSLPRQMTTPEISMPPITVSCSRIRLTTSETRGSTSS